MSAWFSRVSPDGRQWVGGDGTLLLNGKDIGPGYGPKWIDAGTFDASVGNDLVRFTLTADRTAVAKTEVLNSLGHVYFDVAPDGRWVIEQEPPNPQRIVWHDGGVWPGFSTPAISHTRWAVLAHDLGTLYAGTGQGQNGVALDRPCLEPRLAGDVLVWRKGGQIFGQIAHDAPVLELTIPGEFHFWPVPLLINGQSWVLTNTNSGRLLLYPFGSSKGYEVAHGVTDFADAQQIDATHERVIWSEKGEHRERMMDLNEAPVDLVTPAPPTFDPTAEYDVLDFMLGTDGPWPRTGNPGHYMNTDVHPQDRWFALVKSGDPSFAGWLVWDDNWIRLWEDHTNPPFPNYIFTDGRWAPRRIKGSASFEVAGNQRRDWTGNDWGPPVAFPYTMTSTIVAAYDFGGELGVLPALVQDFDNRPAPVTDPKTGVTRRPGSWERTVWAYRCGIGKFQSWKTPINGGPDVLEAETNFNVRSSDPLVGASLPRRPFGSVVPLPVMPPTITIRDDYGPKLGRAPLTWQANAITTGKIDRIVWRWRKQGTTAWMKKDDDEHTTVTLTSPGIYELGADCYGPGGSDRTATIRLITVTS